MEQIPPTNLVSPEQQKEAALMDLTKKSIIDHPNEPVIASITRLHRANIGAWLIGVSIGSHADVITSTA